VYNERTERRGPPGIGREGGDGRKFVPWSYNTQNKREKHVYWQGGELDIALLIKRGWYKERIHGSPAGSVKIWPRAHGISSCQRRKHDMTGTAKKERARG